MTTPRREDAALRRVWVAFADQFLDTETRHDLPLAALAAVEAGLSVDEALDVWRFEVFPVVGANLLSIAGEWAGWDEAWLAAEIREVRRRAGDGGRVEERVRGAGRGGARRRGWLRPPLNDLSRSGNSGRWPER